MKSWKIILALLLLFHLLLLVVSQFTAWPEMLFWPYLILKGWLPYRDIGIAHSPLLVLALAVFYKGIGIGIWQQQIFSRGLVLLTDVLIFFVIKRLFDRKTALLALFFYIFFQVYYDGNGVWFDHALTIFPITIFFFLQKKNYFLVGLFWALAFFTKQTAFWFLLPILLARPNLSFVKGFLLSSFFIFLFLYLFGLFDDFYFWAIKFGVGTLPGLAAKIPSSGVLFSALVPFLIFIPLARSKNKYLSGLLAWSVAAAMGTLPRFELFHFQPALPFLAIAFALVLKKPTWLTFLIIFFASVLVSRGLVRNMFKQVRFQTDRDKKIIRIVDDLTESDELIFVTNYWDNLYPLTDTLPATRPFVPQLTQYITPSFDQSLATDLLVNRPRVVVRGQFTSPADPHQFEKINNFIDNHYQPVTTVGGIDILGIK